MLGTIRSSIFRSSNPGLFSSSAMNGKRESGDMIAVFQKTAQIVEARNLGRQNERFSLPVERKIAPGARTVIVGFAQPLDFDFADGFTDPFRRPRLGGAEENLRGRLRQHGLGSPRHSEPPFGCAPGSPG